MEFFRGIKIRSIFLDNQNWWNFYTNKFKLIRFSIVHNVCKILGCGTKNLGFHTFTCPECNHTKTVYHTCKSRFCSSCGKKATEQWIQNSLANLPVVPYQHLTFTLPSELRDFFWVNRHLMNQIVLIPANIITRLAQNKKLIPGIFTVIHTFGRDLKQNVHFHVTTTSGGSSLDYKKWIPDFYIKHDAVKKMWKASVIKVLRKMFENNELKMPPKLKHIQTYAEFNSWLNMLYQKQWVVHLQKKKDNHKHNVEYVGRYLKRPPLAETRITNYNGQEVSFYYLDHYDKQRTLITLPVFDFIARLIRHIPDANFRLIRYYNWLSNRTRSKLLPIIYQLVEHQIKYAARITWRTLYRNSFGVDPLTCPKCDITMELSNISQPSLNSLSLSHKDLAIQS